jgi:hypothetical protein
MTEYGIDFNLVNVVGRNGDITLDIDLFSMLDNNPKVAQISDLNCIFANPGDYDWDPDSQRGSGILGKKGAAFSNRKLAQLASDIDTQSVCDDRISSSKSSASINISDGSLTLNHTITVSGDIVFTSNILVDGQSLSVALGS